MTNKDNPNNIPEISDNADYSDFDTTNGRFFELTTDPLKLEIARQFEQQIWFEEGYGSLDTYATHIAHSITFTMFDNDNKCKGIARLFQGKAETPPFLTEMPYYSEVERSELLKLSKDGSIEELGTIAVSKELRNGLVFENLARLAYRYSYGNGMKYWGIIMEPERVEKMNKNYGFTFRRLGPSVDYQGGDCAAFIMDLQAVNDNMRVTFPEIYDWFVNAPLSKR